MASAFEPRYAQAQRRKLTHPSGQPLTEARVHGFIITGRDVDGVSYMLLKTCNLKVTPYWEEFERAFAFASQRHELGLLLTYMETKSLSNGDDEAKRYLTSVPVLEHHPPMTSKCFDAFQTSQPVNGPFHRLWFVQMRAGC